MTPFPSRRAAVAAAVLVLATAGFAPLQDRAKKLGAKDVPPLMEAAGKAFAGGRYGACGQDLRKVLGVLGELLHEQLLAAMPPPPAGFTVDPQSPRPDAGANPFGAMLGFIGAPTEQVYRGDGRELRISVSPGSPAAQMLTLAMQMAAANPEVESITYGAHRAIMQKEGDGRLKLQILLGDSDLVEVSSEGFGDEDLLKICNQAFVDRIFTVLRG